MPVANMEAAMGAMLLLFKTAWDAQTPPIPPVIYEDLDADIPADSDTEFVAISIHHANAGQETLGEVGGRTFGKNGIVKVEIKTKTGQGRSRSNALVQIAINAFEGAATTADGVWFRDVTATEIGVEDKWFQVNVLARFTYDIVR